MTGRRHITLAEAVSALRRGRPIEQYLGRFTATDERQGIRWLTAGPSGRAFVLNLHEVEDIGSEDSLDISEFPPLDEDEYLGEGREIETADDPGELLGLASSAGASPTRWVNWGVAQDEYLDDLQGS